MQLLLVDDHGQIWPGDSRKLRAAFDSPYSGGEFVEYSVKNLGFAAVNLYGRSCQIRLRPAFASDGLIVSLLDLVRLQKSVERLVLSTFAGEWRDELVVRGQVEERLSALLHEGSCKRPADFLSAPLQPSALEQRTLLSDIVQTWSHLTSTYETEVLIRLLRGAFGDRYVVTQKSQDRDHLLFQEFGDGMFPFYETWRTCAIGAPIEEQPDRPFGRWVGQAYREAMKEAAPDIRAVDVITRCPVRGRTRLRYKRLIFPLPASSSGSLLLGGSIQDTTVDLRIPHR